MTDESDNFPVPAKTAGPVVLVTGCSSGIGRATARLLRERGWRVFATARRSEDVEHLEAEGFEALVLDLDEPLAIRVAVDELLDATGGRIDALVNNGATAIPGAVEDLSRAALRDQFETNLFGTLELTTAVLAVMRRQGHGRIVNVSSILGIVAMPWRGAYNASKFALEGLMDTLRLEMHGTGIHVSTVAPGPVESRFRLNAQRQAEKHIDLGGSRHRRVYRRLQGERSDPDGKLPFSVPPEAVARKIARALASKRPKPRYLVTTPAHWLAFLRRILPARWLDRLLRRL